MVRRCPLLPLLVLVACQPAADPPATEAGVQAGASPAAPSAGTVEWKIQNAMSAAPAAVSAEAAVMDWPEGEGMAMTSLRPGANGWTCMPDIPTSPTNDPMCFDQGFASWVDAYTRGEVPIISRMGLAYMLQGGSDASNTDPFAAAPAPGEDWVRTGPHVMVVVPDPSALDELPTDHRSGAPYVMFRGTPFAHLMMPVQ